MVHVQGGPPSPYPPLPAALSQPLPVQHPPLSTLLLHFPLPIPIPSFPGSLEQVSHLLITVLAGRPASLLRKRSDPLVSPQPALGFGVRSTFPEGLTPQGAPALNVVTAHPSRGSGRGEACLP